ncbi:hypothetical protein VOLCADRAFT_86383 [Volvox carteri f. nagariensis]|uniref:ABC transporter domain-containing protein n=1 Tax=Volvox carteri f. nagariensis TaxID=3068 RepID=D8TIM4_VOLCA|nr:uncharacterized protein VOLCADRAFT_86383 [Volvox carteri f. nagariensis]EFJ52913.1 hypothetical protein VOLCADRAFT_86383 [Volvox carteri f. nagariensis]|eukprot:XP_002945918.1 hypothetical protein VOLCADRAFT_86383 [Volvox carteri f. nagariensis]
MANLSALGSAEAQCTAVATKRGEVLLIADTLGKSHDGEKQLFQGLTFSVVAAHNPVTASVCRSAPCTVLLYVCCISYRAGDKLAVVGPNGSGKSTLLKVCHGLREGRGEGGKGRKKKSRAGRTAVLAGQTDFDQGSISRNKGARVGFLAQEPPLPAGVTVLQAVLQSDSDMARAVQEYQRALATANGALTKDLEVAIEKMNTYNAWEIDGEAKRVLEAVGITDLNAPVDKVREPTNHMDVHMIRWMERELKSGDMAVVLVTHDRYFMEAVCDRLLELDGGRAFVHNFGGANSYTLFKEAREFRRKSQANAAADARTLFRREAEWMARQPKARQAKSIARQQRFYELTERAKDAPTADLKVDFGNAAGAMARQGNKVIRCERLGYSLPGSDQPIIRDFTFDFQPGTKLGIAGRNGAGKTTLLDLIAGRKQPTSGKLDVGETSVVGYLTQYPPAIRDDLRIIDYIREIADSRKAKLAAAGGAIEPMDSPEVLLEKLGFPRPRQFQKVSSLSGGERRRLHLASVLVERPNVLILDEPTNDLDLSTVEVLEEQVRAFRGVLLTVSHDRAFMDNVAERLMVLQGDGLVRMFDGSYSEYLELMDEQAAAEAAAAALEQRIASGSAASSGSSWDSDGEEGSTSSSRGGKGKGGMGKQQQQKQQQAEAKASSGPTAPSKKPRKLGYYEQQEYQKLTREIDELNAKRDALNDRVMELAQSGSDLAALEAASREMAAIQETVDVKSERWLELAELAGDI